MHDREFRNHAIAVQRVENLRNKVEAVEAERDEALKQIQLERQLHNYEIFNLIQRKSNLKCQRDEALAKVEALKAEIDSLFISEINHNVGRVI